MCPASMKTWHCYERTTFRRGLPKRCRCARHGMHVHCRSVQHQQLQAFHSAQHKMLTGCSSWLAHALLLISQRHLMAGELLYVSLLSAPQGMQNISGSLSAYVAEAGNSCIVCIIIVC